ncbi:2-nitropropane dioxygenase [Caballeronia arationis]|jgi:nitronate monooxygenase|uniref:Nitronate monooxygenase n=1 Tax=Caballeronia arationis TaxID=1777142 RepID=A0A7Z7N050_9BURK|nr:DUF6306 domain-containing protein [Caballeronia arationis]SAK87183.1 2-nitropropane dioxygenase [Caballeronia arationis]SOE45658.1 nitronate monooxygenase [Caballeronia arationis]
MSIALDLSSDLHRFANTLHRPMCDLLGCTWPVVLAGMGGVSRAELVTAATVAGGFGFLGMVREPTSLILKEVREVRAGTDRKFGVNLIPTATPVDLLDAQIATCIEIGVPVVALFWDVIPAIVRRLRDAGITVAYQIGSIEEARSAEAAGVNFLIVQGREAGGHVRGTQPLAVLLPEVVAGTRLPVLAAGGITEGADVATALSLGAQGVVLGTAMIPTRESFAHSYHKQRIVDAGEHETLLTDSFHINWPKGARVRVLANSVTRGERGDPFGACGTNGTESTVIGEEEGRPIYLFSTDSPLRSMTGDFEAMALYAGTGAERISDITGAATRLHQIVLQAGALLDPGVASVLDRKESAIALSEHMGDERHRTTGRHALLATLNELLEAERAGARVASQMVVEIAEPSLKQMMIAVRQDEARWCGVLTKAIQSLDGSPSRRTGAFYEKAMAVADLWQRMAFLNRGQAWVVRKLHALLPGVDEKQLRAELTAMLASHQENIRLVERQLEAATGGAPPGSA